MGLLDERPGLSTRAVAQALGVDDSTADYHLRRLKKVGSLSCSPQGRERRWYPSGCGLCPVLRHAVPALRRAETAAVASVLAEWPTSASRLAQRAGVRVGEARWAIGVLERVGLVERTRSGRAMLREGAHLCLQKARTGEACPLWGKCAVSRSLELQTPT